MYYALGKVWGWKPSLLAEIERAKACAFPLQSCVMWVVCWVADTAMQVIFLCWCVHLLRIRSEMAGRWTMPLVACTCTSDPGWNRPTVCAVCYITGTASCLLGHCSTLCDAALYFVLSCCKWTSTLYYVLDAKSTSSSSVWSFRISE